MCMFAIDILSECYTSLSCCSFSRCCWKSANIVVTLLMLSNQHVNCVNCSWALITYAPTTFLKSTYRRPRCDFLRYRKRHQQPLFSRLWRNKSVMTSNSSRNMKSKVYMRIYQCQFTLAILHQGCFT